MSIALSILNHYRLTGVREVKYLGGAGGFSGAQFWKIHTADEFFCLRRWPSSQPDPARLDWINLVLEHVSNHGCPVVAMPLATLAGDRYVRQHGFLWELAPWMTGQASFQQDPSDAKLENAMKCLAQFHLASAQVNLGFQKSDTALARYKMLQTLEPLVAAIQREDIPGQIPSLLPLRALVVEQSANKLPELAALFQPLVSEVFPVQPVIRDIWHDHLLFTGDQVTGVVDFGAMQIDSVAVDLARLLGSLIGNQLDRWKKAIDDYCRNRPLSSSEIQFASALNQGSHLLSAFNWLKWILVERRTFESWDNVDRRIRHLISGLSEPDFQIEPN